MIMAEVRALSWHLPGENEEDHEKPQDSWCPSISQTRSTSYNHSDVPFSVTSSSSILPYAQIHHHGDILGE
jgi:hypothetical protein